MVEPGDIPNPNWLTPGIPSAGQQQFGDQLLADHLFILIPSAVSIHSWNIIFDSVRASGTYALETQELPISPDGKIIANTSIPNNDYCSSALDGRAATERIFAHNFPSQINKPYAAVSNQSLRMRSGGRTRSFDCGTFTSLGRRICR